MGNNGFAYSFLMGNIDYIFLENIATKPMHGYGLMEKIRDQYQVLLGPSTIYPCLNLLEKKGFIRHHWDLESARPKKVYVVTEKGKKEVRHRRMAVHQILSKLEAISC